MSRGFASKVRSNIPCWVYAMYSLSNFKKGKSKKWSKIEVDQMSTFYIPIDTEFKNVDFKNADFKNV